MGLNPDALLAEIGVPPELADTEDKWIDNSHLTALVKALWRKTGNETFGFDPQPLRIGTWALACEFMITGDTLGELYRKGERILSFLAPGLAGLSVRVEGDWVYVQPQTYLGESDPDHFLMEFMTVIWHRFPSWAIDEQIPLQSAFFSYPRPQHASFYDELFHTDVAFAQSTCGICFHSRYLQKRITRTQRELEVWLRDSPADLLYMPGRESSVRAQLKAALRLLSKEGRRFPAFDILCQELGMSPQVVRRRLADEGTSYQVIKDLVRRDQAQRLLSNLELSIVDVAEMIGFSEPAAFSRAFKKWTGSTPAHYRARLNQ